jgi:MFS family permease
VIFLLSGIGAAASVALRKTGARETMLVGCLFLLAGVAVTFWAIAATTFAAFLGATAVAGAGFSLTYLGAFRMITALATPDQRAGLLAAIFIVTYLAFSVPALIAGAATSKFGLHATALVYSASLALLAAAAIAILVWRPGAKPLRPDEALHHVMPPGPCTGPSSPRALEPVQV